MRQLRPGQLRTGFVFPLFLAGVAVLVGKLYTIQIEQHGRFVELARRQSEATITLPAIRGTIFDCNREPLALSVEVPSIYADPSAVAVPPKVRTWLPRVLGVPPEMFRKFLLATPNVTEGVSDPNLERVIQVTKELARFMGAGEQALMARLDAAVEDRLNEVARTAAPILGVPESEVRAALGRDTRFVWLKRPADEDCARKIAELGIYGLGIAKEYRRRVAEGIRCGQWQGFVGAEARGLDGLELVFEPRLAGTPGITCLDRDGRGKKMARSADPEVPPRHGSHLHLTIDSRLQLILNEELDRIYAEFSPVSASAIIMDPWTGRVLAMDSVPGLSLSRMAGLSTAELERRSRNHPVQSVYEYGSTIKPLIAAEALELGLVTPETRINCENGVWRYRARTIRDTHPYGLLTVTDIIVLSSNIGAGKLGVLLGDERLRRCLAKYRFGERLGLDLPAEEPGIVTPARRWSYFTTTSVPMGQEIAGTPLQFITAFCALINGGQLMQPYIVDAVEDPNTGDVTRRTPLVVRQVISQATSDKMRHILSQVVERGTGKALNASRFPIGGKTGTAQKRAPGGGYSHELFVSSFVGFAPVEQPRICVLVMVDEPKGRYYGAQVAAPAVGRIVDKALTVLESTPQSVASSAQQVPAISRAAGQEPER